MSNSQKIIDIHCHSAIKPFGKSWPNKVNSPKKRQKSSIWHYDQPTFLDKIFNFFTGLTKFRQADFTSLIKGKVMILGTSLYSPEKGFFNNKLGDGKTPDILENFITGISMKRIEYIEQNNDYFGDTLSEYDFYKQLDDHEIRICWKKYKYKLATNYNDIDHALNQTNSNTIMVFLTIEGGHVFNCGLDPKNVPADSTLVLNNVQTIKNWPHPVLFIAVGHHFYNELCGHAKSLPEILCKLTDHEYGLDGGITSLGIDVIKKLLDNASGRRIYIDIKHMSTLSRKEYFQLLKTDYAGEDIPIIVSHGSLNGLKSIEERVNTVLNDEDKFYRGDINFFDSEIIEIEKSNGVFGIQLDENRIGSKTEIKKSKWGIFPSKIRYKCTSLIWNQIQHIAELLDRKGRFAWGTAVLGSDNDGIVNPLNGYWTNKQLKHLKTHLTKYAEDYINGNGQMLNLAQNKNITPDEIVNRFLFQNMYDFLKKYY